MKKYTVKSVLEIGSGPCSTPLFLNPESFPELETLISLETSDQWAYTISTLYGGDKRLKLLYSEDADYLLKTGLEYGPFDIALIDGADNGKRLEVTPQCLEHSRFVVVHDTQEKELEVVHKMAPHSVTSVIESPWTTVLSLHEPPFGYSNGHPK